MSRRFLVFFVALNMLFLHGCASYGVDNADRGEFVTEFYAIVSVIEPVEFESHVGSAIVAGALTGAIEEPHGNSGDIAGGAIVGGFIGGLLTAMFEGPNQGYGYHLDAIDGDRIQVMLDYYPADLGDCVIVRVSGKVSVYKQPIQACDSGEMYVN